MVDQLTPLQEKWRGYGEQYGEPDPSTPDVPELPEVPGTLVYQEPVLTPLQERWQQYGAEAKTYEDQSTAIALEAAKTADPATYRKAQKEAQIADLPPDVVYRNIDQFKEREKLDTVRRVLQQNKGIREWFLTGDNSKTVTPENLHDMNRVVWTLTVGPRSFEQGSQQVAVSRIRFKELWGQATPEEIDWADHVEAGFTSDFGESTWFGKALTAAGSTLPSLIDTAETSLIRGAEGTVIGSAVGSVVPGLGTAAGAGSGLTIGATYGAFESSFIQNTGSAYGEYKRFRTEDGKPIEPELARGAAIISGALSAGLDVTSLGFIMKKTGLGSLVTSLGPKQAIKEALKDKTFRALALQVGKHLTQSALVEGGTEMTQEAIQIALGEAAKQVSEQGEFASIGWWGSDERPGAIPRIWDAGVQGFLATATLGIVPFGGRLALDYSSAKQQVADTPKIQGLVDAAKKDELVKKDPAKAAELAQAALTDTGKETMYIGVDDVKEFLQADNSAEVAALSKIPDFQKNLTEAVQNGGDVAISTADFYAYVATSDAAGKLIDRLKFDPNGMSKKQAEAFVKTMQEVVDKSLADTEPKGSVAQDIYSKARAVGATPDQARQYAALYGAFFDSMATKTKREAFDIYKAYNLQLTREDVTPPPSALGTFSQINPFDKAEALRMGKKLMAGLKSPAFEVKGSERRGPLFTHALHANGKHVADLTYNPDIDRLSMSAVNLGKGEGAAFYDAVEKATGHKLQPDMTSLSPEAKKFWDKRALEQVKDYVQNEDGTWSHPDAHKYYQGDGKAVLRGAITFAPDKTTIRLFRDANLSTLLHESGHLFLQVMTDLVQGRRAFGGHLFQADELQVGDIVQLLDDDGEPILAKPAALTSVVNHPRLGMQVTVEGSKKIYNASRAYIVSKFDEVVPEDDNVITVDELDKITVPVAESPETGINPEGGGIPEDTRSEIELRYETMRLTNGPFRRYADRLNPKTDAEREKALNEYFPNSSSARRSRQIKSAQEQNADPELKAILEKAGVKEADPVGLETEGAAALNVDESVQRISNTIDAVASLEQALSKRRSEKILKQLRISIKKVKTSEDVDMDQAIAAFEAQMSKITGAETVLSKGVKRVVGEYIRLYKKGKEEQAAKETRKAAREGKQAAKEADKLKAEDVSSALTELSNVVARVDKIEQQKEAHATLVEDLKVIQDWLGDAGPLYTVEAHEKFARGFEAYLMEGVAPNDNLRRAFERFKAWLKLVYRRITNLGIEPTPEVKAVFGRMLTSDQTIANEVGGTEFKAAFSTAEEAGMTAPEFEEYLRRVDSLAAVGRDAADKAITDEAKKLVTKAMREKKSELRKQFTEELGKTRVYRVMGYLQGKTTPGLEPGKLDRARVVEILGPKKLGSIPNGPSMWTKTGGLDPDAVAMMFGYASGAEMLADFQQTEPLKIAVEKRVNAEAEKLSEQSLIVPDEVADMASAKLRSDVYKDFLKTEIRAFSKLMGFDFTDAHVAQFQRMANEIIDERTIRNVLRKNFIKEFGEADRRIGRLLEQAIRKKDFSQALDLRRKQLFNHFLINKAYETKAKADKAKKYLSGFSKKKAGAIDQNYLSQIRNLLIPLGFINGQVDQQAASFSTFLDDEIASGSLIVIDPRIKGKMKPYLSMPIAELNAVYDAVKNLEFVGRNKRAIFKEGKKFDLNMAAAHIAQAMDNNLIPRKPSQNMNARGPEKLRRYAGWYFASLTKIEQLCDWIDGRVAQGPAHKYLFQPIADAQAREVALVQKYSTRLLKLINEKPATYWDATVRVAGIGKNMKRSEIMALALNTGNESNRTKLMKGMGWSEAQINEALEFLDGKDWKIVQGIWDTLGEFWPMVVEVNARLGRPKADAIQAMPFTNKHGTFQGGYYPVIYDPNKSADVLTRGLSTQAEAMFGFDPQSMFPPSSFANDRDNQYARPMLLDMRVLPNHVGKITHYISHAEAVGSVTKLLQHSEIRDRMLNQFGQEMFKAALDWVNFVAKGETSTPGLTAFNAFFRALRTNISVAALGFRATTVIAQTGGLFAGAEMIGFKNVMSGMTAMYGTTSIDQIAQNIKFIQDMSPEMRNRTTFMDRDLQTLGEAFERPSVRRKVRDVAMAPLKVADSVFAMGVWMGAYRAQLERNRTDEQLAINYADKVVRLTQGTGAPKDLAAIQRGGEAVRLFTMFYTYFSAMQNRLMDIAMTSRDRVKSNEGPEGKIQTPHEVARLLYLVVLPTLIFDFFMKGALQGQFSDDDENTGTLGQAFWKVFSYSFAGMIGMRDLFSFITKDGTEWRYNTPPTLRTMEQITVRASRAVWAASDSNRDLKASDLLRLGVDAGGITFGLPLDAATMPVYNYLKAQENGEDFSPADFLVRR